MGMRVTITRVDASTADRLAAGSLGTQALVEEADAAVWGEEPDASAVGLGKLWHAIHYLLSGQVWETGGELGPLILGGKSVGDDVGYGPARLHEPAAVVALSTALAAVSDEELHERFDPESFMAAEIYPVIWDEPAEELWEEIVFYLGGLRRLMKAAADAGDAVLVFTA